MNESDKELYGLAFDQDCEQTVEDERKKRKLLHNEIRTEVYFEQMNRGIEPAGNTPFSEEY